MEIGVIGGAIAQGSVAQQAGVASKPTSVGSVVDGTGSETEAPKNLQEKVQKDSDDKDVKDLKDELRKLTEDLNREINPLNTNIKFGFNDKIESLYVNVIDTQTDKTIRKIPSDEAMKLMERMREVVGIIFDKKG